MGEVLPQDPFSIGRALGIHPLCWLSPVLKRSRLHSTLARLRILVSFCRTSLSSLDAFCRMKEDGIVQLPISTVRPCHWQLVIYDPWRSSGKWAAVLRIDSLRLADDFSPDSAVTERNRSSPTYHTWDEGQRTCYGVLLQTWVSFAFPESDLSTHPDLTQDHTATGPELVRWSGLDGDPPAVILRSSRLKGSASIYYDHQLSFSAHARTVCGLGVPCLNL